MSGLLMIVIIMSFLILIELFFTIINKILDFIVQCIKNFIIKLKSKNKDESTEIKTEKVETKFERDMRIQRLINEYSKPHKSSSNSNHYDNIKINKEEYYCERCFKKISEEEFELYDCMCEECFEEVNNGMI